MDRREGLERRGTSQQASRQEDLSRCLPTSLPENGHRCFCPFWRGGKNNDGEKDGWLKAKPNPKVWLNKKPQPPTSHASNRQDHTQ